VRQVLCHHLQYRPSSCTAIKVAWKELKLCSFVYNWWCNNDTDMRERRENVFAALISCRLHHCCIQSVRRLTYCASLTATLVLRNWSRYIDTATFSAAAYNSSVKLATKQHNDTIRDAILTCARKPTWVSLIYRTETTTKKCKKKEKLKSKKWICSEVTVNNLGTPCSQSWRRKGKAAVGRICRKGRF